MIRFRVIKARLITNWIDMDGRSWLMNETGYYINHYTNDYNGQRVVFHFDGYEEEKKQNEEWIKKTGEHINIVSFIALLPLEILETIEIEARGGVP